jgi:hypothetical protein
MELGRVKDHQYHARDERGFHVEEVESHTTFTV